MDTRQRRACRAAVVAGVVAVLAGTGLAQSPDAHVGTWKINLAKSTYSPGPAAKSATTTIEAVGTATRLVVDQSLADGAVRHWEFTSNYDGKDVPVTGNNPDADTSARTRPNANTVNSILKKGGKTTTLQTSVVSSDGKIRTVTTTGTNGAGKPVHNVVVYDRQ